MKTSVGKSSAEVFDKNSLIQIRDWAMTSAENCKAESQRLFADHHAMAVVNDAIADQMEFEALASAINAILED
jgi:hypothetical protein